MKRHPYLLLAAVFTAWIIGAALMLGGCASLNPMAVDPKTTAAAQKVQAQAKAEFDLMLARRLDHCRITGQTGGGLGGLAGTGSGLSASISFECPPKPWEPATVPQ